MKIKRVPLGDIALVNPRLDVDDQPSGNELVSFVPMASVSEATLSIEQPLDRIYEDVAKGFTPFRRGDILIAKITPCFENGKMAYSKDLPRRIGFGSTEFHVLRPNPDQDGAYLFQLLRDPYVRRLGKSKMTGAAGQRRIPARFLQELRIPLPPLSEQKRIAGILDAADALRAKRREALAELDKLLQSTFIHMFGDPVTNPMGWDIVPIGDFAEVKGGKRLPKGEEYSLLPTPYRYIRVADISPNYIERRNLRYLKPETQRRISRYTVDEGDVIISIAGTIGVTAAVPKDLKGCNLTENAAKIVLKSQEQINPVFLSFALQMPQTQAQIAGQTGQVTIGKLALFRIERVVVTVPPIAEQNRFSSFVESIERQKARMRTHLTELDSLFASLQSRAFNGEF